jgi:hypothetical protein
MNDSTYAAYDALGPFFDVVQKGLDGRLTVHTSSIPSLTRPSSSSGITFPDGRRSSTAVAS